MQQSGSVLGSHIQCAKNNHSYIIFFCACVGSSGGWIPWKVVLLSDVPPMPVQGVRVTMFILTYINSAVVTALWLYNLCSPLLVYKLLRTSLHTLRFLVLIKQTDRQNSSQSHRCHKLSFREQVHKHTPRHDIKFGRPWSDISMYFIAT